MKTCDAITDSLKRREGRGGKKNEGPGPGNESVRSAGN